MYSVKRFPSFDKNEWANSRRDAIASELAGYGGLFKEHELDSAFQDLIIEHIFLQDLARGVAAWRENFVKYVAASIQTSEAELNGKNGKDDLTKGRLLTMKEMLEWF
jgi:hypothetical protein